MLRLDLGSEPAFWPRQCASAFMNAEDVIAFLPPDDKALLGAVRRAAREGGKQAGRRIKTLSAINVDGVRAFYAHVTDLTVEERREQTRRSTSAIDRAWSEMSG